MPTITQVLLKLLSTGIFSLIIWLSARELWHIWVPGKPVIAEFDYSKDGESSTEEGLHFAQLMRHDLMQLELTHRTYYATIKDVLNGEMEQKEESDGETENTNGETEQLPRTDHIDQANLLQSEIDLPELGKTLPDLEIELYGIDLSTILRRAQRAIRRPNEITGIVIERTGNLTVYSEFRQSGTSYDERWHTFVSDVANKNEASYELGIRLFKMFAQTQIHDIYGVPNDGEFALFMNMLRNYQKYQLMHTQNKEEKATKALIASRQLTERISDDTEFPFMHDLAARILEDAGEDEQLVKHHVESYLAKLAENNLPEDPRARSLLGRLENKIAAKVSLTELPIQRRIRPVTSGASVANLNGTAGTLCCIVQDRAGIRYLLSANHTLGMPNAVINEPVLQPGPFDGGKVEDRVAILTKWLPIKSEEENFVAGAIAQLDQGIVANNKIPGVGKISGIANSSEIQIGTEVKIVGRTSGLVKGEVQKLGVKARIMTPKQALFGGLIQLTPISRGGDSGAPVLTADNKLVGMVYAGSRTSTLVIPIQPIFDALNVTLADDS